MARDVLIVDDNRLDAWFLRQHCAHLGLAPRVMRCADFAAGIAGHAAALTILSVEFFRTASTDLLAPLRAHAERHRMVLLAPERQSRDIRRARQLGFVDTLLKPFNMDEVGAVLRRWLRSPVAAPTAASDRADSFGFHHLVGTSAAFLRVVEVARKVARSDSATMLIEGESGTGKDMLAKAVHFESARYRRPFVEITTTALPEHLLESELFGHERGAFTDAKVRREGLVPSADGGTLFLNEIGDMSLSLQAKVLRVIEQRVFRPVGAPADVKVNVRIIAATCVDLRQAVAEGRFRPDLYYRLAVIPLRMPALRDRPDDVEPLARAFVAEMADRFGRPIERLSARLRDYLSTHPWPGNVRELRNFIERAMILGHGPVLDAEDLDWPDPTHAPSHGAPADGAEPAVAAPLPASLSGPALPADGLALRDVEEWAIRQTMEQCQQNVSEAARRLQIGRDALRYRLKRLGINPSSADDRSAMQS